MYHYLIIKRIIELLDNDLDIINFLKTCKFSYAVRKTVTFTEFPLAYCYKKGVTKNHLLQENQERTTTTTNTTTTTTTKSSISPFSGLFKSWRLSKQYIQTSIVPTKAIDIHLPLKFSRISIQNEEEFNYYQDVIKDIIGIEEIMFHWVPERHFIKNDFKRYVSENTTSITILRGFNMTFTNQCFPKNLEFINLGLSFQCRVEPGSLPSTSLKTIVFMDNYSTELVPGSIPECVTSLFLSNSYNYPFKMNVLPKGLTKLELGGYSKTIGPGILPETLIWLDMGGYNIQFVRGTLPNSIETLFLPSYNQLLNSEHLPLSLKSLDLGGFTQIIAPGQLPVSIKTLYLANHYDQNIDAKALPELLLKLSLGREFNQILNNSINILPKFLTELYMGFSFTHDIPVGYLPPTLKILSFKAKFNREFLPNSLPQLSELYLGRNYNKKLRPGVLPNSLAILSLGESYNQDIEEIALPPNLVHLQLSCQYITKIHKLCKNHSNIRIHYYTYDQ